MRRALPLLVLLCACHHSLHGQWEGTCGGDGTEGPWSVDVRLDLERYDSGELESVEGQVADFRGNGEVTWGENTFALAESRFLVCHDAACEIEGYPVRRNYIHATMPDRLPVPTFLLTAEGWVQDRTMSLQCDLSTDSAVGGSGLGTLEWQPPRD